LQEVDNKTVILQFFSLFTSKYIPDSIGSAYCLQLFLIVEKDFLIYKDYIKRKTDKNNRV